jgi:hypothetical protein
MVASRIRCNSALQRQHTGFNILGSCRSYRTMDQVDVMDEPARAAGHATYMVDLILMKQVRKDDPTVRPFVRCLDMKSRT